jgi:hypothetical protein
LHEQWRWWWHHSRCSIAAEYICCRHCVWHWVLYSLLLLCSKGRELQLLLLLL